MKPRESAGKYVTSDKRGKYVTDGERGKTCNQGNVQKKRATRLIIWQLV